MNIKCLIVDDEPLAIEVIESHISQLNKLEVVAIARNAIKAFEILEGEQIDLIFLDIQMPKLTGIDLLKTIKNPPKVIFTTAYADYALEGYELDVVDYLVKPISFERFLKAVNKYFSISKEKIVAETQPPESKNETVGHIFVKTNRKNRKVRLSEIMYVESVKDYIKIHTLNERLIVKETMIAFETKLPKAFLRVHRSYIVNLDKLTAFTSHDIEIGSVEIPIGVSYKQKVFERLN